MNVGDDGAPTSSTASQTQKTAVFGGCHFIQADSHQGSLKLSKGLSRSGRKTSEEGEADAGHTLQSQGGRTRRLFLTQC